MFLKIVGGVVLVVLSLVFVLGGGAVFLGSRAVAEHEKQVDRMEKVARASGLSPNETSALIACNNHMRLKKVYQDGRIYAPVPDSFCVCHAAAMSRVMNGASYWSHQRYVDAMVRHDRPPTLDPREIRSGLTTLQATQAVDNSFRTCLSRLPRDPATPAKS